MQPAIPAPYRGVLSLCVCCWRSATFWGGFLWGRASLAGHGSCTSEQTQQRRINTLQRENGIVWREATQADNFSFFLSIQKSHFGILHIPTVSLSGPHSRLRRETQDKVSHTGYKTDTKWWCKAGKKGKLGVIDRNSQEKKSSGRRLGLMRAAGPWMTEKPSVSFR